MYELYVLCKQAAVQRREHNGGKVRLGRTAGLEITISGDAQVSRHHATLEYTGSDWMLTDEKSANGTFLNGTRLEAEMAVALSDRDRVSLGLSGQTTLIFRVHDDTPSAILVIRHEESLDEYTPHSLVVEKPDADQLRRQRDRLFVLYEASRAVLSRVEDLSQLLDRLKLEVVNALRVDEMIVALKDPHSGDATYDVVNRRDRFRSDDIAGSKTVINEVIASGKTQRRHVGDDEEVLSTSTSLVRLRVRSVICVPMAAGGEVLGAIYVQNPSDQEGFTDEDSDFMVAFAGHVALAIREAFNRQRSERALAEMRRENVALRDGIDTADPLSTIVGQSEAIDEVRRLVEAVKDLPSTVLIVGESGTGKELVAKALHYGGTRSEKPFVSVNVAACPEGLLESELFGHEKGAFTGASARKIGRFEQADEGTLFLDEIGEVPPLTQVKLLRVLQERSVERVGGNRPIPVDVRLVFATNRDLEQAVREGQFREDFYYRVNVVRIPIPPLRERAEDIPPLVEHILARLKAKLGIDVRALAPAALELLKGYEFPGNVRELENMLERAFIRLKIRNADIIEPPDLPLELVRSPSADGSVPASYEGLKSIEREMVREALKRTGGNKRKAAAQLGVTPQTLYNKLAEFDLKDPY